MDLRNLVALGLSYGYVFGLLAAAEWVRKRFGLSGDFTRKAVHIGVGMWSVATLMLFTSWKWGIVPPASFVLINYLSYRYEIFKAIESTERANLGTVFFPLSFALLLGLLWRPGSPQDSGPIAVSGLMAMTWGDALASIIGRRYGTRRYRFFGHARTMEGTLAMFLASTISIALTLSFLDGRELHQSIAFAMIGATVAAGVEAVSLYGSDNLTVPLATAGTLYLLTRLAGPLAR